MLRSFLSLVLTMALLTTATAQTAPATTKTATKTTVRKTPASTATKRKTVVKKTAKPVQNQTTTLGSTSRGTSTGPSGNGAVGSSNGADGKGQGVYAAPGMAVDVTSGKEVQSYRGEAPATNPVKKSSNTLSPSSPAK